jgi:ribosomal subunit interface protein
MQIHWRKADQISEALQALAQERIESLAKGKRDLIDVWVELEPSSAHHRMGAESVSIRAQARGKTIVAHAEEERLETALRVALDRFDREVMRMRHKRQARRTARPKMSPPHLGIIDRLFADEGYGFLLSDSGEQIYFHENALNEALSFESLEEGSRVAFNFEAGDKGLQATVVAPPPIDASSP